MVCTVSRLVSGTLQSPGLFSDNVFSLLTARPFCSPNSVTMTKYVDFTWVVPVPQELLDGTVADKWIEEKDSADLEHEATFRWEFLIIT